MNAFRPEDLASAITAISRPRCVELLGLVGAGLAALDPEAAVRRALAENDPDGYDLTVIAIGKAAPAMARGAGSHLGGRVRRMLVVSDHNEPLPAVAERMVTSHPIPDKTSLAAGERALELAGESADHVLFLISGGGSALAEVPRGRLTIDEVAEVYEVLLREGVTIEDSNLIRTHLSSIKGGKLASVTAGPTTTIVLSDVGPRLELVASGPSIPTRSSPGEALDALRRLDLLAQIPTAVLEALSTEDSVVAGPTGRVIEVGSGATAVEAMAKAGERRSLPTEVVSTNLRGEASEAAEWAINSTTPGRIGIFAGETTVTVRGSGRGGRNQEAALAAALLVGGGEVAFLTFGTDGVDGPTDAAGAYVDAATFDNARQAGFDPVASLAANDSHPALDAAGALIRTGPTGINVADIWLVDRR